MGCVVFDGLVKGEVLLDELWVIQSFCDGNIEWPIVV